MLLAVGTISWIALVSWVATAGGGFVMLAIWIRRGGMRQRESGRIRPPLILGHFLLAATGLVLWIIYLANDSETLKWVAFAILAVVALLGWTMFAIWYQRRQREPVAGAAAGGERPAEKHFPVSIVALHGVLAVTTVVL